MKNKITLAVLSLVILLAATVILIQQRALIHARAQNDILRKNAATFRATVKQAIADADAATPDPKLALSGIYFFYNPKLGEQKMDLRTDGTALTSVKTAGGLEYNRKKITWHVEDQSAVIENKTYKPEGYDLIDPQANRWIRVR